MALKRSEEKASSSGEGRVTDGKGSSFLIARARIPHRRRGRPSLAAASTRVYTYSINNIIISGNRGEDPRRPPLNYPGNYLNKVLASRTERGTREEKGNVRGHMCRRPRENTRRARAAAAAASYTRANPRTTLPGGDLIV